MTLDGVPLGLEQTAVKRFLRVGASPEAYDSQWGLVMAPSDLTVGSHTLDVVATNAAGTVVEYADGITFFVDAPGTGACL